LRVSTILLVVQDFSTIHSMKTYGGSPPPKNLPA
jgi:hypothetical protein